MSKAAYGKDIELQDIEPVPQKPDHPLDAPDVQAKHKRILAWRKEAGDLQRSNRFLQMRDHDFYDGDQWDAEDIDVLQERGQMPLVFNVIKRLVFRHH